MNIDELINQMREDELADARYITPVNYAKIRPVSSPQVYQLLRNRKLQKHTCACGRTVISIQEADTYFSQRRENWPVQPEDPNAESD